MQEQGISEMALVVVEHPIAGHDLEGIQKKAEAAYSDIITAATQWNPK